MVSLGSAGLLARYARAPGARVTWGLAALAGVAICLYFWLAEGGLADTVFSTTVTLAIGAAIVWLGRRPLMAAVLVVALVALIRTVAYARQQASEVLLHAYDVVTFATSWPPLASLWQGHRQLLLSLAAGPCCDRGRRLDRLSHRRRACPAALRGRRPRRACPVASVADSARGERRHTEYYFEFSYVTFFYTSWSETLSALWRGRMVEAAEPASFPAGRLDVPAQLLAR